MARVRRMRRDRSVTLDERSGVQKRLVEQLEQALAAWPVIEQAQGMIIIDKVDGGSAPVRAPRTYRRRVLDADGTPIGTCFQVAHGVMVTAWLVLDDLGCAGCPGVGSAGPRSPGRKTF
jgi:hypothetical protein